MIIYRSIGKVSGFCCHFFREYFHSKSVIIHTGKREHSRFVFVWLARFIYFVLFLLFLVDHSGLLGTFCCLFFITSSNSRATKSLGTEGDGCWSSRGSPPLDLSLSVIFFLFLVFFLFFLNFWNILAGFS